MEPAVTDPNFEKQMMAGPERGEKFPSPENRFD